MRISRPKQFWYVATLVVASFVDGKRLRNQLFDRQVKLLRACSNEEAYQKALALGKKENHSYGNSKGEKVSWKFVGLENLSRLLTNKLSDGEEVISWLERGNPKAYVRSKQNLTIFWYEANRTKTAGELLADPVRPYAPA